jgi:hypothetical protein
MPGGAIGPNVHMMVKAGILDRYGEVLAEFPVVVEAGGAWTSVTPGSQQYWLQAFNNVLYGRWEKIDAGLRQGGARLLRPHAAAAGSGGGEEGAEQLQAEPFDGDPLEAAPDTIETAREALEERNLPVTDENVFLVLSASCRARRWSERGHPPAHGQPEDRHAAEEEGPRSRRWAAGGAGRAARRPGGRRAPPLRRRRARHHAVHGGGGRRRARSRSRSSRRDGGGAAVRPARGGGPRGRRPARRDRRARAGTRGGPEIYSTFAGKVEVVDDAGEGGRQVSEGRSSRGRGDEGEARHPLAGRGHGVGARAPRRRDRQLAAHPDDRLRADMEIWVASCSQQSGFVNLTLGNLVMFAVAGVLIYLAVTKNYEPLLLIPIGFGAALANLPLAQPAGLDLRDRHIARS